MGRARNLKQVVRMASGHGHKGVPFLAGSDQHNLIIVRWPNDYRGMVYGRGAWFHFAASQVVKGVFGMKSGAGH